MQAKPYMRSPRVLDLAAILLFVCVQWAAAQERFESGDLKGFTKSPTEHIIVELEKPFEVRQVKGVLLSAAGGGENFPLGVSVLFEIRGPGESQRIRSARARKDGNFRIRGVPEGKYKFKVTADGWQSVVGTLLVFKKADRKSTVKVILPLGV